MQKSVYPCGWSVDAREPVDYSRLKWNEVFTVSRRYFHTYNVSDTRHWLDIVSHVEYLGLPTHEYSSGGSPGGHAAGVEYYFAFLDGGLACHDFWGLRNGCQVTGYKCVRYLCYQLGLNQPRRWRDEECMPTLTALEEEIKIQKSDPAEHVCLTDSIDRFRRRFI